ncbi:MAG: CDGSH iron-sulfur domain-containing protein [Burkholderiales bacterium]
MAEQEYRGKHIVVRFDGQKCIHSRHCVLLRPEVFQANVPGDWIKPDNASTEAIVNVALACPSGAITWERLDGGAQEGPPPVNLVRVRENGPLAVHAEIEFTTGEKATRATLCRCGASKNKPFCDGSHVEAGFSASGEPPTQESTPLASRAGSLRVWPKPDGPLEVTGNVEIVSGTGRTVNRLEKTWLCRCGQSQKKPYCDGTHKRNGFKA